MFDVLCGVMVSHLRFLENFILMYFSHSCGPHPIARVEHNVETSELGVPCGGPLWEPATPTPYICRIQACIPTRIYIYIYIYIVFLPDGAEVLRSIVKASRTGDNLVHYRIP